MHIEKDNLRVLTSGSVLARNTVLNLLGQGAPLLVAIFTIPLLIKGLGTERFGVLTLGWIMVGYLSLIDMGLGRALTQLVAKKLGTGQEQEIPSLVWTSLFLMLVMGLIGALLFILLSPWLVYDILKIPIILQSETLHAFYLIALSIPIVIITAALRGVLEAYQRFGAISILRILMGMFTYLGPVMVLPFSQSIFVVIGVLVLVRLFAVLAHLLISFYSISAFRHKITIQIDVVKPLINFGSWMTVTNIIGPLMVYLDRFLIGALVSVTAVTYYSTPSDVVRGLSLISGAIAGVLFPAFATSLVQDYNRASLIFSKGVKYTFIILFPITLLIVTLSHEGLSLWLGSEFAQNSTHILQWLAIGVFINGLAQIPFALVQGAGRADLTAKLHLIELPFYLFIVWWAIGNYGIEGAAVAWVMRAAVDALFLFGMAQWFLPSSKSNMRWMALPILIALLILAFAVLLVGVAMKVVFLVLILIIFMLITWRYFIDNLDKQKICTIFSRSTATLEKIK